MGLFKFTQHGNFIKSQNGSDERNHRTPIKARCLSTTFQNKVSFTPCLLKTAIHQKLSDSCLNFGFTLMI